MAQGFAAEVVGVLDATLNPAGKLDARVSGGRVRRRRAVLDLSLATVAKNSGDTNLLCRIPRGEAFAFGIVNADATMGATATIAIGNATTAGKYRAAAIFTAAAPTLFGPAGVEDDAPLTDYEDVIMTIAAANLPGAGILVIDIFTSGR
jgi:hypothetical protein